MQDWVHSLVKEALEVAAELLAQRLLDSLQDVGEDAKVGRVVLVVVAALEDTGSHQARVPAVHVAADDVRRRVVSDHVDVLGELLLAVELSHPRGEHVVGVLVGGELRLAVDDTLEVDTGEGLVHGLEADAEGSLGHAGGRVLGRAEEITLGEVDGDALSHRVLGHGAKATVLAAENIHDDLHVGRIVSRVGEDHDGLNADLGEVTRTRGGSLLVSEDAVRGNGRVPSDNVIRDDDVAEAILLSNLTASVALATDDKHSAVVLSQSTHGCVGLDELVRVDGVLEDLGQLLAAGRLDLARSVGEEDVGDLDAELIVSVQDLKSLAALGDETVAVDEHTVNVKGEGHVLGLLDLLGLDALNLSDEELPGRLDRGHARTRRLAVGIVHRREARLALAGDGESCAKRVAGGSAVPHGGSHAEVVHVLAGLGDGGSGGGHLDGAIVLRSGNGEAGLDAGDGRHLS